MMKRILIMLILFMSCSLTIAATHNKTNKEKTKAAANLIFDKKQTQAIEAIVKNYLLEHPEILMQMVEKLRQQQMSQVEQHAIAEIKENAKEVFANPNDPVAGSAKGTVTLVEFFDYQCPHCKDAAADVKKLAEQNPNLRVVLKEFPIFDTSMYVAKAALASMQQGKYWAFHNALFAAPNPLTQDKVMNIAKSLGIDTDQLQKDLESPAIENQIKQNYQIAQTIGINTTPTFIIAKYGNGKIEGKIFFVPRRVPYAVLEKMVETAGKNKK